MSDISPRATRYLIVNADDFGQSEGVNQGIIEAHEQGVVTSATMMVRWPAARAAAAYARSHPSLGVGLHFDLGEWILKDGEWSALYRVVNPSDSAAVAEELATQLARFQELVGRPPTHIDSHQHVHQEEPARTAVRSAARQLGIPVRSFEATYCGRFYGQDENAESRPEWISVQGFLRILDDLGEGVTEICCHPAATEDLSSMYSRERLWELETLCSPVVRTALKAQGIRLIHFGDFQSMQADA